MPASSTCAALVFGAGGLLGSAIRRVESDAGRTVLPARVDWSDPTACEADIAAAVAEAVALTRGATLEVHWCAGAGVTSSPDEVFEQEIAAFRHALACLEDEGAARTAVVFLASSAGALYAGATGQPFDDASTPQPLVPYGRTKLQMERTLQEWVAATDARGWAGRISNLYGPGQDLEKPQGLISHLLARALDDEPINIFMPLDTRRDYLYVDDGARMALRGTARLADLPHGSFEARLLCSGETQTIAAVMNHVARHVGRPVPYTLEPSGLATGQSTDLTFVPTTWAGLDHCPRTELDEGIRLTLASLGEQASEQALPGH